MVSKVADGGPASKEDGLKVQDRILKVSNGEFSRKPASFHCTRASRSASPTSHFMT